MVKVSVKQALERVASAPPLDENADYTELRVHELVARALFDIANDPNPRKPGAMARATKAQRMILDRMVGTRKPGSSPVGTGDSSLEFVDLTQGALE